MDPITNEYPELTPYQFASNRPIDGIDLDGLEYLDSDKARFESKYGRVQLKVKNFNHVFRTNWWIANMNAENWKTGEIGLNPTIVNIKMGGISIDEESFSEFDITYPKGVLGSIKKPGLPGKNSDPNSDPTKIVLEKPKNRFNVPDQRFKDRYVSGKSNRTTAGSAAVGVANLINLGLEFYTLFGFASDQSALEEQLSTVLVDAVEDMKLAIKDGMVSEQYLNPVDISNILNVVIQGENTTDDPKIYEIGISIVKEISGNYKAPESEEKEKESESKFKRFGEF